MPVLFCVVFPGCLAYISNEIQVYMEVPATPDAGAVIRRQRDYFATGATRSYAFRKAQVQKIMELLVTCESEILDALYADLGKHPEEAYSTEIGVTLAEARHTLQHLKEWMEPQQAETSLLHFPGTSRIFPEPYGVTFIIAPWNYPVQLLISPLLGAVAAGNTAILKPSELAPATSQVLAKMINTHFSPEYIYACEGGPEVTTAYLEHPLDYIFFTGGTEVGRIVYQAAARHLTPVTLELGGKNPCVVHEDASIQAAARRIAWSKVLNCGQVCVSADTLYIHESRKEEFVKAWKKYMTQWFPQGVLQDESYGRIINEKHFRRLLGHLSGGQIITGGGYDETRLKIEPALLEHVPADASIMQEEIFGPLLPVITYRSLDEIYPLIRKQPKPLAAYIFTNSRKTARQFLREVPSGGAAVNEVIMQLVSTSLPFGGVGNSGIGAYHGKYSFDTFSHHKGVLLRYPLPDVPLRFPPYRKSRLGFLKFLMRNIM